MHGIKRPCCDQNSQIPSLVVLLCGRKAIKVPTELVEWPKLYLMSNFLQNHLNRTVIKLDRERERGERERERGEREREREREEEEE